MRWLDNLFQHLVVTVRCALPIFIYRNKLFRRWHCKKLADGKWRSGGSGLLWVGVVAKVFPILFEAFVAARLLCVHMSKYLIAKYLRVLLIQFLLLNSIRVQGWPDANMPN